MDDGSNPSSTTMENGVGKLIIHGDYEVSLTKKDIKVLKRLKTEIEIEITRRCIQRPGVNTREEQSKEPRLKTLYKLLNSDGLI